MKTKKNERIAFRVGLIGIILSIVLASNLNAQPSEFEFFARVGNDPNMALFGAYPDREVKAKGLHNKYGIGFEWVNTRLGTDIESFSQIGFTKWTYFYFDYKVSDVIRNVNLFGGVEMSQVKRHHPDYAEEGSSEYREYTINPVLFGLNGEIQYRGDSSPLALGLQANIHQAEDELKPYKKYRFQVFVNLYFYL